MAIICGCLPPTNALFKSILPKSLISKTGASSDNYHTASDTNRYIRKGGGGGSSYEPEGFERIIDSKTSQDAYSCTTPHDSSHVMELGSIGVQTDLHQQYERRKPEDGTWVTRMAWPR